MKDILIVVDMQNDFLTGSLGNKECAEIVPAVAALIESRDWHHVFVTLDTHRENYPNTLEGKKLPIQHCITDTEGHLNASEVGAALWSDKFDGPDSNDPLGPTYIEKFTFGSLRLPLEIMEWARYANTSMNDVTIHMCGVCTSICVLTNAAILRTYFPDTRIVIHKDDTADTSPEMKEHALKVLEAIQCDIVLDDLPF